MCVEIVAAFKATAGLQVSSILPDDDVQEIKADSLCLTAAFVCVYVCV